MKAIPESITQSSSARLWFLLVVTVAIPDVWSYSTCPTWTAGALVNVIATPVTFTKSSVSKPWPLKVVNEPMPADAVCMPVVVTAAPILTVKFFALKIPVTPKYFCASDGNVILPTPVANWIPANLTTFAVVKPWADAAWIVATPENDSKSTCDMFILDAVS